MKYTFKPSGVCSRLMEFDIENGIVTDVAVTGGCSGNLKGIVSLVKGMPAEDVIARLNGIRCGSKSTSCPDQLARGLSEALRNGQ